MSGGVEAEIWLLLLLLYYMVVSRHRPLLPGTSLEPAVIIPIIIIIIIIIIHFPHFTAV